MELMSNQEHLISTQISAKNTQGQNVFFINCQHGDHIFPPHSAIFSVARFELELSQRSRRKPQELIGLFVLLVQFEKDINPVNLDINATTALASQIVLGRLGMTSVEMHEETSSDKHVILQIIVFQIKHTLLAIQANYK